MQAEDVVPASLLEEKAQMTTAIECITRAHVLESAPVIRKIAAWCLKHNPANRDGAEEAKPTLAVVYFDTGADSQMYMDYKVVIGEKINVSVPGHKLPADVPIDEVLSTIHNLNDDPSVHGILIQRPIPEHLFENDIMDSVTPIKHVEEFTRGGKANNIALDGLTRVLDHYGKAAMLKMNTLLLGGISIITPPFREALERKYHSGRSVSSEEVAKREGILQDSSSNDDTILLTELGKVGMIKPGMLGPAIKLVVDLGFDSKMGDLDPDVFDMDDLLVIPSPGGVLPVLLWIMMERTIRAQAQLGRGEISCLPQSCSVL